MTRTSQAITKKDLDDLGEKLSAAIATNSAEVHRLGVLVETTVATKVQATLEGLTSTRDELLRAMSEMEARLDRRIGALESVVRGHSSQIERLTTRVDGLTTKVDAVTTRVDELTTKVDQLSTRVDEVTTRVDGLSTRVNQLATEVRDLRRRFDRREDLDAIERRVTEIEQRLARRPVEE